MGFIHLIWEFPQFAALEWKSLKSLSSLPLFSPKLNWVSVGWDQHSVESTSQKTLRDHQGARNSIKKNDFLGYEPALKWSSEGLTFWRCQTRDSQKGDFLFLTTTKTFCSRMTQFLGFVGIAGLGFMRIDIYHFKFWVVTDVLRLG